MKEIKAHLVTAIIVMAIGVCIYARIAYGKPSAPTRPARGTASMEFVFNPPVESVKFKHPAFTTITCSTRSGLEMEEPPSTGTVTGFSTAPFARIALCISDQPMVEVP